MIGHPSPPARRKGIHPEDIRELLATKVRATIAKYSMIEAGSSVLAAVSGGADSVVLLDLLNNLRPSLRFRLAVAHLNHGVRGAESDADAALVEGLAGRLRLDILIEKVDAPALASKEKRSLEEACREARRRFLLNAAKQSGCRLIATGHHADDQAETVLMRLIRGTGVTGLAAIQPVTAEGFIRPLLECSRKEIRTYLRAKDLPFREDPTNLDRRHLRNRIRHDLIPLLAREFNPSIVDTLCRVSRNMAEAGLFLSELGSKALQETQVESERDRLSLDLALLGSYDQIMWRYVFSAAYKTLTGDSLDLTHRHLQALGDLAGTRPTGTSIHLPRGIRARRGYGVVQLYREGPYQTPPRVMKTVAVPGLTEVPDLGGALETRLIGVKDLPTSFRGEDPNLEFFDLREISPPLIVRVRQDGDRIKPFGSKGTRKLKDVLIDLKVPREVRSRLPVLSDGRGLLWIVGLKRSDRAKIVTGTHEVLSARWLKGS